MTRFMNIGPHWKWRADGGDPQGVPQKSGLLFVGLSKKLFLAPTGSLRNAIHFFVQFFVRWAQVCLVGA